MSASLLLLMICALLVYCGILQRVLDRMCLTDRQAWCIIGVMIIGTFLPNVEIGIISLNIGGAMVPLGICLYLLTKADQKIERWRSVIGSIVIAACISLIISVLPSEAEALPMDPMWIYGGVAGILAWLIGRSRRCAFICGISGVVLADIISAAVAWLAGYQVQLRIGGGGIADATIFSGVLAVLLCELVGELAERLVHMRNSRV